VDDGLAGEASAGIGASHAHESSSPKGVDRVNGSRRRPGGKRLLWMLGAVLVVAASVVTNVPAALGQPGPPQGSSNASTVL
jgi:hypothetical protein